MNDWSMGLPGQQGWASSLSASQIFVQLIQLYAVVQIYYPSWCQENPFLSFVKGRSDNELCDLVVIWNQWIGDFQTQLPTAGVMV